MVTAISEDESQSYLAELSDQFKNSRIFLTRHQAKNYTYKLPQNVIIIDNVNQFKEELSNIS